MSRTLRSFGLMLVGVFAVALVAACGGSDDAPAATAAPPAESGGGGGGAETTVAVSLGEFFITPSAESVPAGEVTFNVANDGVIPHEFIVVRTDLDGADLPATAVGVDVAGLEIVGNTDQYPGGESRTLEVELTAGHYVLLCNIAGHYAGGMHANFVVN